MANRRVPDALDERNFSEHIAVAEAMIKYGGGFVRQLGYALQHADAVNRLKIQRTWPDYWEQYKEMALSDERRKR